MYHQKVNSKVKSKISDVRSQMSDVRCQMSDVRLKLTSPERGGEQGIIQDQKTYENQPH